MTFAEDVRNKTTETEGVEYPTAFGITFSPLNTGIGLGILGILGATFIWFTFGAANLERYNKLKAEEASKQEQVKLEKNGSYQQKVAQTEQEIIQAKRLQENAYSLFANEQSGDTLLLDINRFAKNRKTSLQEFTPDNKSVVVSDGSLGPLVNNKLKKQTFNFNVQGDFLQVHELMRDIEKLQPLLLVKNFKASTLVNQGNEGVVIKPIYKDGKFTFEQEQNSKIKTSFRLDLISPLSRDEIIKLNPPAPTGTASPDPAKK